MLIVVLIVATPLPRALSDWLSESTPLGPAEAIVVIGGGGVREDGELSDTSLRRTYHGIRLYQRGLAPLLVLAGASSTRAGHTEAAARARLSRSCGVREEAILATAAARTTGEEAREIARLLAPRGVRTILLVADAEGMGRAQRLFRRAGFHVVTAPVNDVSAIGAPEAQFALVRRVMIELLAWAYYGITGRL